MARLERLLNLAAALSHTSRPLTFAQIRDRVPGYADGQTGRRLFERDKEELRGLGFDLDPEQGGDLNEPGYRLRPEDWTMGPLDLDPDEAAALSVAASIARLEGENADLGLRAASRLAGPGAMPPSPVASAMSARLGAGNSEILTAAADAVNMRKRLTFTYRAARGEPSTRDLEPYGLVMRNGRWYVVGFDRGRNDQRAFRLDRIEGEPVTSEAAAFTRPPDFRPEDAVPAEPWSTAEATQPVRVVLDAPVAWWAQRQLSGSAVVAESDDGSVTVDVEVAQTEPFLAFVSSLLDQAEILSPPELRAALVERMTAMAGMPGVRLEGGGGLEHGRP